MARLVLWDIDHTLIENGGISKRIYLDAYRAMTGHASPVQPITEGRTDRLIMRDLFQMSGEPVRPWPVIHHALVRSGAAHREALRQAGWVLPGAVAAVTALSKIPSVAQGLLTGNIRENAAVKLAAFGIDRLFDLDLGAYGADHDDRPALVAIARRRAEQKTGATFRASDTVLIGDTPRDVEAARMTGAHVVAVASGSHSMKDLAGAGAQVALPNLADTAHLVKIVLGLGPGA